MNLRENYEALINHQETQWTPNATTEVATFDGQLECWENGPIEGGMDDFGCNWIPTDSAGGQPTLDPRIVIVDDVCDWEDKVTFPDLDAIDWEKLSGDFLPSLDRKEKFFEYHTWNSVFLRYSHLLGFENGLCAFYEEPEAAKALCDAIADYKIALLERVAKWFKPDAYVHYDDVATERSLFMSPEVYREFNKPAHTRMNDAARALGIIPEIHICGYCTDIIPDVIEEGSQAWHAAQPMNDLAAIMAEYGDRIAVIGGYDTQGLPALPGVADETIIEEVHRCMEEYAPYKNAYGFFGFLLGDFTSPENMRQHDLMFDEVARCAGAPYMEA